MRTSSKRNRAAFAYPDDLVAGAREAADRAVGRLREGVEPFDTVAQEWIAKVDPVSLQFRDDRMKVQGLHHVQLAMPPGMESAAEEFYTGLLGIPRVAKPEHLEARGGGWFESDEVRIHLGVEEDFSPARKAHPALLVSDLTVLQWILEDADVDVVVDEPLSGFDRFYADDPFGNRIEFLSPSS